MVYACFVKVAYYCWLKIRLTVLIWQTFVGCIEKENQRQGRLELKLTCIYAFNDFVDAKRYINSLAYLAKFSVKILFREGNQNIMSSDYKFLSVAIFPENLIKPGY
jgi:hypothetical protein